MGVGVELLLARDEDIAILVREPERAGAFLDKNWSGAESEKDEATRRSMTIWKIFSEVDYLLRAGLPAAEFPSGFLFANENVLGRVKRTHRKDDVTWHDYEDDESFPYGPPHAFFSKRVAEINRALAPLNDERIREAYNPDELVAPIDRKRFTASDYEQHIQVCQGAVRELRAFLSRANSGGNGLILFYW